MFKSLQHGSSYLPLDKKYLTCEIRYFLFYILLYLCIVLMYNLNYKNKRKRKGRIYASFLHGTRGSKVKEK